jgi:hypothetical protein
LWNSRRTVQRSVTTARELDAAASQVRGALALASRLRLTGRPAASSTIAWIAHTTASEKPADRAIACVTLAASAG